MKAMKAVDPTIKIGVALTLPADSWPDGVVKGPTPVGLTTRARSTAAARSLRRGHRGHGRAVPRLQLIVLLLVTGVVSWAAHVYARLACERIVGRPIDRREARRVARHEWSVVEATRAQVVQTEAG